MAMSQVIRETMESYQDAAVKALTVAENEAARDVDKVVGAYTRLYRRGYADGYADAKKGNPSHVVDAEAAAIGESISLDRADTERLDLWFREGCRQLNATPVWDKGCEHEGERWFWFTDREDRGQWAKTRREALGKMLDAAMSADAGTAEGHGKEASDGSTGRG